jgi:flagellar assembly protein FliH
MLSRGGAEIRPVQYPSLGAAGASLPDAESQETLASRLRELGIRIEEKEREFARTLESERQRALEQGRRQAGNEEAAWCNECSAQLQQTLDQFCQQREEYFARVEHEVVRLALAIAERILHREARLDPMLLAGAVRVALGQLSESTEVKLRVPADQAEMWAEMVRLMPNLPLRPEVRPDGELQGAEAVLEASLGTVDLGVRAQLAEIERGFFDVQQGGGTLQGQSPELAAAAGRRG